jgi:four helix bundle protein
VSQGNGGDRGSRVEGRGYQQLFAWQRAHQLSLALFRETQPLAAKNNWLRSQCNRAAVSVAANIAEGYNRGSLKEYLHFLTIARGSLAEVEYYTILLEDSQLLSEDRTKQLAPLAHETGNLILGLIRSLRQKDTQRPNDPRRISEGTAYDAADSEDNVLDPRPSTLDPLEVS